MKKKMLWIIAAAGLLCGCGYDPSAVSPVFTSGSLISSREQSSTSAETRSSAQESSFTATSSVPESTSSSTTSVSSSTSTTSRDYSEIPYIRQSLTSAEKSFAEKSLFIGDSICRGLEAFDVLSVKNVMGAGNVAARNIFSTEYYRRGKDVSFLDVIKSEKPRHVIFWFGMNDVNMTSSAEYCENYRKVIDAALAEPIEDVYVMSVSPVCSDFTDNGRIVRFNSALMNFITENYAERVHFVDIHDSLTDENGDMAWYFSSGDGVHLNELAYYRLIVDFFAQVDLTEKPVFSSSESSSSSESVDFSSSESSSSMQNSE